MITDTIMSTKNEGTISTLGKKMSHARPVRSEKHNLNDDISYLVIDTLVWSCPSLIAPPDNRGGTTTSCRCHPLPLSLSSSLLMPLM